MVRTMKAFIMKKIGSVGMMEKPAPDPGPNDAIVKTTAALVCTSDVHTVGGALGERTNLTLGHEAVGVIHKLGGAVKGFREGDRVAVNAITPCYHCENCLRGYPSQCTEMLGGWKFANVKDGNLAEYFHVNSAQANLAPIPLSLTDEQAAYCTDMISTGLMGAEQEEGQPHTVVRPSVAEGGVIARPLEPGTHTWWPWQCTDFRGESSVPSLWRQAGQHLGCRFRPISRRSRLHWVSAHKELIRDRCGETEW